MKATTHLKASCYSMVIALLAGLSANAQTLDFRNYNAIVFNDFTTQHDVEGRTFIGNNFTGGNSANFGIHMHTTDANDRVLVVGNNLVAGNPIQVQHGKLYIDGTANGRVSNSLIVADHSIDAATAAIQGYSILQSQALSAMVADSVATYPSSQPAAINFNATPGADRIAVFNVSDSNIFGNNLAQQFNLNVDASLTDSIIINVDAGSSGGIVNWQGGANMVGNFTSDYWQSNVLWNFYNATSITLNHEFNGGILAPYASLKTTAGPINGLVVVNNLDTDGEVHVPYASNDTAYTGYLAPVPEPGSAIFLLAAGGLLFIMRNRKLMA